MRVAIVADTHGFLDPRVEQVVAACDVAVHCGDIGDGVLPRLQPGTGTVVAVRGNNDAPATEAGPLAREALLDLPGGTLVVVHGDRLPASRRHAGLRRAYPHARVVVYGHSHRLLCDRAQRPWVANPGAAGRRRTYGGPSCLVLVAGPDGWRVRTRRFTPLAKTRPGTQGISPRQ